MDAARKMKMKMKIFLLSSLFSAHQPAASTWPRLQPTTHPLNLVKTTCGRSRIHVDVQVMLTFLRLVFLHRHLSRAAVCQTDDLRGFMKSLLLIFITALYNSGLIYVAEDNDLVSVHTGSQGRLQSCCFLQQDEALVYQTWCRKMLKLGRKWQ